jgi:N-glycosylase/DNA lyase
MRQIPGFDLSLTAGSGQCFRFNEDKGNCFNLIAFGKRLKIRVLGGDHFMFGCDTVEFEEIWQYYFDLDCDYRSFGISIDAKDAFLSAAFDYAGGLRILRQSPWETLVSFIISQR